MKNILLLMLSASMVLIMGLSSLAGDVTDVDTAVENTQTEQVQEDAEPRELACRYCGGPTTTLPPEYGRWVNSYTEACPDGRMGCLHMIQEHAVANYYSCTVCGRTTSSVRTEYQDLGHFSGTRR